MNTLTLLVTYKTKPNMAKAFVEAVTDAGLLDTIRAEDGCLRYDYYYPATLSNEVLLVEAWESAEHQSTHLQQPHMQQVAAIKAVYVTDTTVQKFTNIQ